MNNTKSIKHRPTVSVVIPTCNRAPYVGRAIKSVLDQTLEDFELLVVDDASTDNTEEIVSGFSDKRIVYIPHHENKGGSAARNTGIKAAKGDYIAFLDDDDEWLPQKLEYQMDLLSRSTPVVGAIYSGFIMRDLRSQKDLKSFLPARRGMIFHDLVGRNFVGSTSVIVIKKECFARIGLFDENLPSCQDWDMWLRISRHYEIDFVDKALVIHNVHGNRISTNFKARVKGKKILLGKIWKDISSRPKLISRHHFGNSKLFYLMDDKQQGKTELIRAVALEPLNAKYMIYFIYSLFRLNPFKPFPILRRIRNKNGFLSDLLDHTYD